MAAVAAAGAGDEAAGGSLKTTVYPVGPNAITITSPSARGVTHEWELGLTGQAKDENNLSIAAAQLRESDVPVAFPTETVYGLGADATRSAAVRGIYRAKQRPSDNPLIVHVHSVSQLKGLLRPAKPSESTPATNGSLSDHPLKADGVASDAEPDPVPKIYQPLIQRFWPGPLTLIMPNPRNSLLAPEVTAGLSTFGVRMPSNRVALALLKLADRPLAAPSANASTRPSPTTAQHVKHDLDGRIATIVDGGACDVGVESSVVDGLSDPPLVLRPGGIGIEELRRCPGWEGVTVGYEDSSEKGERPRAPGMKYKHYSPRARVVLFEAGAKLPGMAEMLGFLGEEKSVGVVRTSKWPAAREMFATERPNGANLNGTGSAHAKTNSIDHGRDPLADGHEVKGQTPDFKATPFNLHLGDPPNPVTVLDIHLGPSLQQIAQGLFSAIRELDAHDVDAILVEGVDEGEGDVAAAVMNRLRKAAETSVR